MTTTEAKQQLAIKLKNARKSRRISVSKLAKIMHVPEATISALESQAGNNIPLANLNGLVNRYLKEVDLDRSEVAEELAVLHPRPQTKTKKITHLPPARVFVASRATLAVLAGIVLTIVLGYALLQAWQLTSAPQLDLETPAGALVTDNPAVEVKGVASPESSVLVNGSNVSLEDDGSFSVTVYMQPGQNFLQVRAINAFGHEAIEERIIIYSVD